MKSQRGRESSYHKRPVPYYVAPSHVDYSCVNNCCHYQASLLLITCTAYVDCEEMGSTRNVLYSDSALHIWANIRGMYGDQNIKLNGL